MFRGIGGWEIGLILVIVLIVFGVGKLPQVGGAIGKGIRNFKKAQSGEEEEEAEAGGKQTSELEMTKAKLAAAEAKLKVIEESNKK
jgi:sec-independent protein translocase protein TatA